MKRKKKIYHDMQAVRKGIVNQDFASVNGCMHACGHDMHMAMLPGAAKPAQELSACAETYAKELLGRNRAFSVRDLNAMSKGQKKSGSMRMRW